MTTYTPGMRVEIRDAEWRIERVDQTSDGAHLLACQGLSELVRGRTAQFLTVLEQGIQVLDPAETMLVDDLSDGYLAAQLYLDTALRQTPPVDERIHAGHQAAMDLLPFQLDPALQALRQPRQRILIADSVGLGKTLEAGILVSELIRRGRGKRILVLAVKSMLGQFQREFWQRFTIPLVRLDSVGLQRVRNDIPTNHNPFHYYDRAIISIDTLKQTLEYRHYLEQAYWDIIVIDEAHNVARRSTHSQRHKLAELLSTRSDTLIMLSATPHDGKAESFASLMNMLDPTAIANPRDYAHEDFRDKGLVIRRFKHDVADQLSSHFPEREIGTEQIAATVPEEQAFSALKQASFHSLDGTRRTGGRRTGGQLFRTTLEKALFSSPAACLSTIDNRLQRLLRKHEKQPAVENEQDISTLEGLRLALRAITPDQFSKYQLLLQLLRPEGERSLGWQPRDSADRLVVFTESLVTLEFLEQRLPADLKLKPRQLAVLRGTLRDSELMDIVEDFGRDNSPIRLLLCSDVAAEGINLHHLSHRMVHFDIPWSLMTFQQRNGRIDRYGQTQPPQIRYLMTLSADPAVRGDQRVLEVLIGKDEQAGRNIGDPSEFMRGASVEEEEDRVARVIEADKSGADPDDISAIFASLFEEEAGAGDGDCDDGAARTVQAAEAGLAAFTRGRASTGSGDLGAAIGDSPVVFADALAFAGAALACIKEQERAHGAVPVAGLSYRIDKARRQLDFTAPADLRQRLKYLPREARPDDDRFILTDDRARIQQAIRAARDGDDALFSNLQYLWPQHPVMEWLMNRCLDAFGRHTAPVIRLPSKLGQDEHWYILQGGFPNRRGQALIQASLALHVVGGEIVDERPLGELLATFQLNGAKLPNRALDGDTGALRALLPAVVAHSRGRLQALRDQLQAQENQRLHDHVARLEALRDRHIRQLELDFGASAAPEALVRDRRRQRQHQIDRVFEEYRQWLDETRHTEREPYIQVVAVLTGQGAVARPSGQGE